MYFLILDQRFTEKQWLAASGVRDGSPAAGIAARTYACFFCGATDVLREYTEYYKKEYRDVWDFLYWHYLIDAAAIKALNKAYKKTQLLLYGDVHAGGDYYVGDYAMEEDQGFPVVERIFATLRGKTKP
jgi:hypothetical protein